MVKIEKKIDNEQSLKDFEWSDQSKIKNKRWSRLLRNINKEYIL